MPISALFAVMNGDSLRIIAGNNVWSVSYDGCTLTLTRIEPEETMSKVLCPNCGTPMEREKRALRCPSCGMKISNAEQKASEK